MFTIDIKMSLGKGEPAMTSKGISLKKNTSLFSPVYSKLTGFLRSYDNKVGKLVATFFL